MLEDSVAKNPPVARAGRRTRGSIGGALLDWYEDNARVLPWRVGPKARAKGVHPDPYAVWLSEIMLQQTTVATVTPRYGAFLAQWPTVMDMAASPVDDVLSAWAGLGYYARARNLHKCARVVAEEYGGIFPDTEEELRALPGIGAYTAAAIAAIAFNRHAVVVDGNIERVTTRLFAIEKPIKEAKPFIKECAEKYWPAGPSGDFAQAMMDLGATVCTPKTPNCEQCPISDHCTAYKQGKPGAYPVKAPKKIKPTRYGAVFVLCNADGEVLLECRPEKGLLGGMLGLPGGAWVESGGKALNSEAVLADAPEKGRWALGGEARHTFTHFHLVMDVYVKETKRRSKPGEIWRRSADASLPTVMRKALDVGLRSTAPTS